MADANRIAAALRYQQGMALPTPEPDSMVGRALDAAAQWGRGVQKNVSDLVSPTAWAEALKNPPRGVLSQMNPENKQEMINQGIDSALNFGPAMLGKIVYHGSPHRFQPTANNPLGEFDPMKIGTGEGAQAYGAGAAYLAEAPGVAKGYQAKLAAQQKPNVVDANLQKMYEKTGDWSKAVDEHMRRIYDTPKAKEKMRESLIKQGAPTNVEGGSLYKVDLPDEHIAKMLDWDKPLSEQSSAMKALNSLMPMLDKESAALLKTDANKMTGAGLLTYARKALGDDAKASQYLAQQGIPGIRYLDQGSRSAPSSAQFAKDAVVGAADDLTAMAKSMGLNAEVRHSGSNAGKSSYVSVFDPMTNRYIKSSFRISDHGTGPLRHQEHIHINSPADLATQKNDLFEWVKRNRTEKGVDTTGLSAPSQGTSNFVVFDPKHMNIIGRE